MTVKIDQAFINAFIDSDFGLDIAYENTAYEPTAGKEYFDISVINNDTTGYTLSESDETDGIFRVILYWPANEGSINAKLKAEEVIQIFYIGADICYQSQCATIRTVSRGAGVAEDGWYKIVLTFGYYAEIIK